MTLLQYTQRQDTARSEIVERGIEVQASFSTLCAVEYLKSRNVPPQVIQRVLLQPAQRRESDRVMHKY